MHAHIIRPVAVAACLALAVSGCGREPNQETPSTTASTPTSATATESVMPTVREAPPIPASANQDAAAATAQTFAEMWVAFSPANPDALTQWANSWSPWATGDFAQEQKQQAQNYWSWTWNTGVKTCCATFPAEPTTTVSGNTATVIVPITWWEMPLLATQQEIEEGAGKQTPATVTVELVVRNDQWRVTNAVTTPVENPAGGEEH